MPDYKDILLEEQYKAIVKANEKLANAAKNGMAEDYAKLLRQMKTILSDAYEQYSVDGKLTYDQLAKYKRIEKLRGQVDEAINTNTKPVFRKMTNTLQETAQQTFTSSLGAIAEVANANIGRELSAEEIQDILSKPWEGITLKERIGLRRTDLGVKVNARIMQAGQREDTYKDLMGDLRSTVTKDYAHNSRLMEDMQHSVQSDVSQMAVTEAQDNGIEVTKTWVTAGDNRVRDDHAALDGQTVGAEEMFTIPSGPNKGMEADAPGLFGIPEEDINCRCFVVAGVRKRED
jgi:hypothetical protein